MRLQYIYAVLAATTSLDDQHGDSIAAVANGKLFAIGGYTISQPAPRAVAMLHPDAAR